MGSTRAGSTDGDGQSAKDGHSGKAARGDATARAGLRETPTRERGLAALAGEDTGLREGQRRVPGRGPMPAPRLSGSEPTLSSCFTPTPPRVVSISSLGIKSRGNMYFLT